MNQSFAVYIIYIYKGGTIASLVAKYGPFKENIIKLYTKQILEGLEYLHARNIIHRGRLTKSRTKITIA